MGTERGGGWDVADVSTSIGGSVLRVVAVSLMTDLPSASSRQTDHKGSRFHRSESRLRSPAPPAKESGHGAPQDVYCRCQTGKERLCVDVVADNPHVVRDGADGTHGKQKTKSVNGTQVKQKTNLSADVLIVHCVHSTLELELPAEVICSYVPEVLLFRIRPPQP